MGHLLSTTLAFFTPQSGGSPNANQIDSLYKILLVIALVIFVAVMGAMVYALVRFRARKGVVAGPDPRQHAPGGRLDGRPRP